MDEQIQLISDDDGIAVIGEPSAVDQFLESEGLPSEDISARLTTAAGAVGAAAQMAGGVAENSGRWVKLTKESAEIANRFSLMTNGDTGLKMGIVVAKGSGGQIKHILQFSSVGSLFNPATIASAGAVMSQMALQQSIDQLAEYLVEIDEKVEDVLRSQKDAVLADMIGVDFVVEDAMTSRGSAGRVDEYTWSKVQGTSVTISRTQAYALRQLGGLAQKLEKRMKLGELADATEQIEPKVREWLAVIAHCFQLQESLDVLELDRVLDAAPDDVNRKRLELQAVRENRVDRIKEHTDYLLTRMDAAAQRANTKVLLQPIPARAVVRSSNLVGAAVGEFHQRLGVEGGHRSTDARRWLEAVIDVRDQFIDNGADGVDTARKFGVEAFDRARLATGRVAADIAERALRERKAEDRGGPEERA
ncbi:hypothetical protein [Curtobacterium sp. Leaf261]|uniref:hypothetical protein n=1 Tax=Curtobacterium sp. Leaf261 TaxID=1736311 RepID=UPI0006F35DE2|nr:hypothetical protein [Curtobacterium sp. Leaf261]KQO65177.1 hypothetical protein ASF23_03435 [Curtobacterium sp. Leaf261]